jgi:hypothetical protein
MKQIVTLSTSRSGHNFILNNVLSWFPGKNFIHYNLENTLPHLIPTQNLKPGIRLIIVRDFMNWLASLHIHLWDNIGLREEAYWGNIDKKIQAYEAILSEMMNPDKHRTLKNAHGIYYDWFFNDRSYREMICDEVGGEYNEDKIDVVPPNGRYSSFDGDSFNNEGSKMKVLNRFEQIMDTEHKDAYVKLIKKYQLEMDMAYSLIPKSIYHQRWLKENLYD